MLADIIFGVVDALLLLSISFMFGRMYEREKGVYKKAYEQTVADMLKFVDFLHTTLPKFGIMVTKQDGSVVSPIQIKQL